LGSIPPGGIKAIFRYSSIGNHCAIIQGQGQSRIKLGPAGTEGISTDNRIMTIGSGR
jgi:hypothetical protein